MSIQDEKTRNLVESACKWWMARNPNSGDRSIIIDSLATKEEKELAESVYDYLRAKARRRSKWSKE
jgi:hypothetical protein